MVETSVGSVVVDLLMLLLFVGALYLVHILLLSTLCHSRLTSILLGEESWLLTLTVFLISCDSQCCVFLPYGVEGCSAVCEIVISPDHTHLLCLCLA